MKNRLLVLRVNCESCVGLLDGKRSLSIPEVDGCKQVMSRHHRRIKIACPFRRGYFLSIVRVAFAWTLLRKRLGKKILGQSIRRLSPGRRAKCGESFDGFVLLGFCQSLYRAKHRESGIEAIRRPEIFLSFVEFS